MMGVGGAKNSHEEALELWQAGTDRLLAGDLEEAMTLFTRSLELSPTAEAYTFRGWAYSFAGRLEEAIEECRKAIATDPSFGNPYNDIGCYLMEQGKLEEAISWFEQAKRAPRYEPRHFPYLNLGRLRAAQGDFAEAILEFEGALAESPDDPVALRFLEGLKYKVN
jgi:Tfp pilus assembly protein PilF